MKNPLLTILVFVGVFICGGVVGGAVSIHYYEHFVRDKGADRFFDRETKELGAKLELTAQQWKELRVIFARSMADLHAMRKQSDVITDRMVADFEAMLTPAQLGRFKEYRAKQRAIREQQIRDRRAGQPGGPEGKPPPSFFMEHRERDRSPDGPVRPEAQAPAAESPAGAPPAEMPRDH